MTINKETYQNEKRFKSVSRKTDKEYYKWHFLGWYPLPNLEKETRKMYMKKNFLYLEDSQGEIERFDVGEDFDMKAHIEALRKQRKDFYLHNELKNNIHVLYEHLELEDLPQKVAESITKSIELFEELDKEWGNR